MTEVEHEPITIGCHCWVACRRPHSGQRRVPPASLSWLRNEHLWRVPWTLSGLLTWYTAPMDSTYTLAPNPPAAMSWDDYESLLESEWPALLDSSKNNDEAVFQDYLERHPCLLPEPYSCFRRGHHRPIFSAVITQPELPGARPLRPDFMWLAVDSGAYTAVLIEIEAPSKRWSKQEQPQRQNSFMRMTN